MTIEDESWLAPWWRNLPKRWGHAWHSMCSYLAMFPPSLPRSIMLALAPYLVFACAFTIPLLIATLLIYTEQHPSFPEIVFFQVPSNTDAKLTP